jgi:hypothetical protein
VRTEIEKAFSKPGEFSVPDSPAAWLLGDSAPTLSRPQTVSELAMELSRVGSGDGTAEGISVVFAPLRLFGKSGATRARASRWDNLELSAGVTAPKDAENTERRAAVGVSFTLYDTGDPRGSGFEALARCMNEAVYDNLAFLDGVGLPTFPGDARPWAQAVEAETTRCKSKAAAVQRAGNSLKLGLGKGWAEAHESGWRDGGAGAWLAGAHVPGTNNRLSLLYRLQVSRLKGWSTQDAAWRTNNTREAALQVRYDADQNGTDALLELGASREPDKGRTVKRVTLGLERQVYPGLWLVLSVTGRSAIDPDHPATLVLGKLKYQFGGDSLLGQWLNDQSKLAK